MTHLVTVSSVCLQDYSVPLPPDTFSHDLRWSGFVFSVGSLLYLLLPPYSLSEPMPPACCRLIPILFVRIYRNLATSKLSENFKYINWIRKRIIKVNDKLWIWKWFAFPLIYYHFHFSLRTFGELKTVRLPQKPGSSEHRGFGFVDFVSREDAKVGAVPLFERETFEVFWIPWRLNVDALFFGIVIFVENLWLWLLFHLTPDPSTV